MPGEALQRLAAGLTSASPSDAAATLEGMLAELAEGRPAGPGVPSACAAGMDALLARLGDRLVLPTSGSTSRPRLVVRGIASWTASFDAFTSSARLGAGGGETVWTPGPVTSTLTLFAAWHAFDAGWDVLGGGGRRHLAAADRARVTCVHAVPLLAEQAVDDALDGRMPALRTVVTAGAHVPARLRARAHAAGVRLVEYYGAAELSFVAIDPDGRGLRAFPGVDLRVRGSAIEVVSPYTCDGYLGDVDGPLTRTPDGWLGVGDTGRLVGEVLSVVGRAGGACVGGVSVLLADVEGVLRAVDGVGEVACLAVPHAQLGQVVGAVAQPLPGRAEGLRDRLRAAAADRLPPAARPRHVVVTALPRTASGKVDLAAAARLLGDDREAAADLRAAG